MKAARFYGVGKNLVVEEVPTPQPGPGEALVAVKACGICGTDIHIAVEGIIPTTFQPITLGHEVAGVVVEIGPGVNGVKVGDRVCIFCFLSCGHCINCQMGRPQLCLYGNKCIGVHADGGLAEYVCMPIINLVPLPESISFEHGAILTDAVATPFHAITVTAKLRAGESVAVFGCGGLGIHAIQIARLSGASLIIAVDMADVILERASRVGADVLVNASRIDPVEAIREATHGLGVDLALEMVGLAKTISQSVASLCIGGRAVVVGVGTEPIQTIPIRQFVRKEVSLLGSYAFTPIEIQKVVSLVQAGKLDLSWSISHKLPLKEINEGLDRLYRKVDYPARIVILPEL